MPAILIAGRTNNLTGRCAVCDKVARQLAEIEAPDQVTMPGFSRHIFQIGALPLPDNSGYAALQALCEVPDHGHVMAHRLDAQRAPTHLYPVFDVTEWLRKTGTEVAAETADTAEAQVLLDALAAF